MSKFYTVDQIAKLFNINAISIYRWIRTKRLKAYKWGRIYRVKQEDLDEFTGRNDYKN